jgi:hypothetical protein
MLEGLIGSIDDSIDSFFSDVSLNYLKVGVQKPDLAYHHPSNLLPITPNTAASPTPPTSDDSSINY